MGSLRTLLAISVVLAHTAHSGLVGGRNAVQMFYAISGFLISYVLVEKKGYPSIWTFYVNRYLRLFPVYAVVAIATLLALSLQPDAPFWAVWRDAPWSARVLLFFSNLTLFGQDWVMFARVQDGVLLPAKDFYWSQPVLYPGLLAPQAWTLGVELTFYLIAPFVLVRKRLMLGLLVASLVLRGTLIRLGFGLNDPWTYRFFPTELALFLLGASSHRWLLPRYRRLPARILERLASSAAVGAVVVVAAYQWIPIADAIKTLAVLGSFVVVLPLLFEFQRLQKADRLLGELSYPIYINHMLVILGVDALLRACRIDSIVALSIGSIAGSIVFAILLDKAVARPVERLRMRIKAHDLGTQRPFDVAGAT